MAPRTFANAGAQSTCASPITNSQTTVTLVSASGFPAIASGTVTDVIILDSGNGSYSASNPLATNYEYQPVTSIAGNVLTFGGGVRAAYAGTTPKAYSAGATIAAVTLAEGYAGTFPIKIAEAVLGGLATSFPSVTIPSGFRSLLICGNVQGNAATVDVGVQFNGDTTNNYAFMQVYNIGGGPSGGASVITSRAQLAQAPSGTSSSFTAYIGNHGGTLLTNHPIISVCSGAGIALMRGAYWNQSVAITAVQVVSDVNMIAGSLVEVFGIP